MLIYTLEMFVFVNLQYMFKHLLSQLWEGKKPYDNISASRETSGTVTYDIAQYRKYIFI